ncbi:hypothetical protein ICY20_16975 [Pseudomonas sp. P115]|uniref:hypothetical protein n=1 Tax=Pseudomonas pisciculturae TaxID=2730413 RepID=UPI00135ABF1B|nr:hypothetical protein [Pseudomonas pisciculturae]MBF6029443.1 hypothetical protein [Pseudomonas pisciculturae]
MTSRIHQDISTPHRPALSWRDGWDGGDKGLIKCWEVGRELATKRPDLEQACLKGELPTLGWKGGVSRSLKKLEKFGSLNYLAQWQGLRGENLDIDPAQNVVKTCSRTGMIVTFTPDKSQYINQTTETDE